MFKVKKKNQSKIRNITNVRKTLQHVQTIVTPVSQDVKVCHYTTVVCVPLYPKMLCVRMLYVYHRYLYMYTRTTVLCVPLSNACTSQSISILFYVCSHRGEIRPGKKQKVLLVPELSQ